MNRAIFLDRDGVLNPVQVRDGKGYAPTAFEDFVIFPEAPAALRSLRAAGYRLIVVTNQPDVAAGKQKRETVERMHEKMARELPLDDIKVCYHSETDDCACRKPKPGMILEAAKAWGIDLGASYMVGDRWKDVEAGKSAGCRTIFIDNHFNEQQPEGQDWTVKSILEASRVILDKAPVKPPAELKLKIFADGADLNVITQMSRNPLIQGFTTNPTLMRKNNIPDYKAFALQMLKVVPALPISFEVFSDDFSEMEKQAVEIASWGKNVYVKIPVTNTLGQFSGDLVRSLSRRGIQLNVTALMTVSQVEKVMECFAPSTRNYVSVFAGRVADTGRDPMPIMREAVRILKAREGAELIWASPRELLNIYQAEEIGCHIITATNDILSKLPGVGKDLDQFSLETVQMFRKDAIEANFKIG